MALLCPSGRTWLWENLPQHCKSHQWEEIFTFSFPLHLLPPSTRMRWQCYLLTLTWLSFTEDYSWSFYTVWSPTTTRNKGASGSGKLEVLLPQTALHLSLPNIRCITISVISCKLPPTFEDTFAPQQIISADDNLYTGVCLQRSSQEVLREAMDMRLTYRKTSVTALEAARNRVNVLTEVVTARRNYYLIAESLQANSAITISKKNVWFSKRAWERWWKWTIRSFPTQRNSHGKLLDYPGSNYANHRNYLDST